MAVLKEWLCLAHGPFESSVESPDCPMGCDTVERAFFTPPGLGSSRTKNIDSTLESLASSHGLTDIGPAAMRRKALAAEKSQEQYKEFCVRRFGGMGWGNVPKGGTLHASTGEVDGTGPGAISAVQAAGAQSPGSVQAVKESLGDAAKPRPVLYRQDPENLKVKAA